MALIRWAEPALSELDAIAEYIALENPTAARALVARVLKTIERLERHPYSGRIPREISTGRYREIVEGPCRVLYRPTDSEVYILHVMRNEQNLRRYLLGERDTS